MALSHQTISMVGQCTRAPTPDPLHPPVCPLSQPFLSPDRPRRSLLLPHITLPWPTATTTTFLTPRPNPTSLPRHPRPRPLADEGKILQTTYCALSPRNAQKEEVNVQSTSLRRVVLLQERSSWREKPCNLTQPMTTQRLLFKPTHGASRC